MKMLNTVKRQWPVKLSCHVLINVTNDDDDSREIDKEQHEPHGLTQMVLFVVSLSHSSYWLASLSPCDLLFSPQCSKMNSQTSTDRCIDSQADAELSNSISQLSLLSLSLSCFSDL